MSSAPISCRLGIPEEQRSEAGRIVYAAFRRKLEPLLGAPQRVQPLLAQGFNLELALGAFAGERLVGVAGLHVGGEQLFGGRLRDYLRALGPLHGMYSYLALVLFDNGRCPPGEVRIAALAVDAAERGRGVGALLLAAVERYAAERGLRAIRLDVVDTNVGARQLYERVGFVAGRVQRLPFLGGWLGFSGVVEMVKPLRP